MLHTTFVPASKCTSIWLLLSTPHFDLCMVFAVFTPTPKGDSTCSGARISCVLGSGHGYGFINHHFNISELTPIRKRPSIWRKIGPPLGGSAVSHQSRRAAKHVELHLLPHPQPQPHVPFHHLPYQLFYIPLPLHLYHRNRTPRLSLFASTKNQIRDTRQCKEDACSEKETNPKEFSSCTQLVSQLNLPSLP